MRFRKYRKMYTYHIKEMLYVSTCKNSILKLMLFSGLLFLALVLILLPQMIGNNSKCLSKHVRFPTDLKYILFWKTKPKKSKFFFNKGNKYASGQSLFIKQNCEYINCYITYNRSFLGDEDYDAVVFDVDDVRKLDSSDFNLTRSPQQKYIFKSFESSEKHPICNPSFDDYFNWTWTYKLNSDIPEPFFHIYDDNNKLIGPKKNMHWAVKMKRTGEYLNKVMIKDKAIAWIDSKCKTKHMHQEFVKELQKEMKGYNYSLDTYGPCSPNKCSEGSNILNCYKMIEKRYFFVLVLEDAYLVEDYITDKVVKAMSHVIIPIVLGGADYKNFLPPGAYINAQAFDLKQLGALIDYLIKNRQMYELFFDWKNRYYYSVKAHDNVCNLCNKLNENNNNNTTMKTYNEFRQWWNYDYRDVCQRKQLLGLFDTHE